MTQSLHYNTNSSSSRLKPELRGDKEENPKNTIKTHHHNESLRDIKEQTRDYSLQYKFSVKIKTTWIQYLQWTEGYNLPYIYNAVDYNTEQYMLVLGYWSLGSIVVSVTVVSM